MVQGTSFVPLINAPNDTQHEKLAVFSQYPHFSQADKVSECLCVPVFVVTLCAVLVSCLLMSRN